MFTQQVDMNPYGPPEVEQRVRPWKMMQWLEG